jgi:hypothetical protein
MQELQFNSEVFQRTSGFYAESVGKIQKKEATIKVLSWNGIREEKLSEVSINLSDYIDRGLVTDKI